MDFMGDNGLGLTGEQTEKVLQFQDLTGIEDMTVCREVLQRHQWDLEVAVQEQLNMREGRPSVFAREAGGAEPSVSREVAPQHTYAMAPARPPPPHSWTGLIGYVVRLVVSVAYETFSEAIHLLLNLLRGETRPMVTDPLGDVMAFIEQYNTRYGTEHPVFYQGTYAQALRDAKQELKFLIVYLHVENATDTQEFVRTLSDESVTDFINRRALFWACEASSGEGARVAAAVCGGGVRRGALCVVCTRASRMAVVGRMEGACDAHTLLQRLTSIFEDNEPHLAQARADRVERSFNQSLRAQQDEAYAASLAADQEKERRRRERIDQERREQEQLVQEIVREEERKREVERARVELAASLPAEPSPAAPALALLFKLPCGTRLERRFAPDHTLQDLYNYVYSQPQAPEEFEITTNFPKRVLERPTSSSKTLTEVGLNNRDVLFVNDSNA